MLPLAVRRKIVDLRAGHPPLDLEESAIPCHETTRTRSAGKPSLPSTTRAGRTRASRYLRVDRSTVYRAKRRLEEEAEEGGTKTGPGRPKGVHKVELKAMVEIRQMQENPGLGESRVQATLE